VALPDDKDKAEPSVPPAVPDDQPAVIKH